MNDRLEAGTETVHQSIKRLLATLSPDLEPDTPGCCRQVARLRRSQTSELDDAVPPLVERDRRADDITEVL